MIGRIQPHLESRVQIRERSHMVTIDAGEKLFPHGPKETFDLATPFGLIRWRMHDQDADRSADALQLPGPVDLAVIDIQPHRNAARRNRLTQAIQQTLQTLIGIKLTVWDQTAGIIQNGTQKRLPFAAAVPLD